MVMKYASQVYVNAIYKQVRTTEMFSIFLFLIFGEYFYSPPLLTISLRRRLFFIVLTSIIFIGIVYAIVYAIPILITCIIFVSS